MVSNAQRMIPPVNSAAEGLQAGAQVILISIGLQIANGRPGGVQLNVVGKSQRLTREIERRAVLSLYQSLYIRKVFLAVDQIGIAGRACTLQLCHNVPCAFEGQRDKIPDPGRAFIAVLRNSNYRIVVPCACDILAGQLNIIIWATAANTTGRTVRDRACNLQLAVGIFFVCSVNGNLIFESICLVSSASARCHIHSKCGFPILEKHSATVIAIQLHWPIKLRCSEDIQIHSDRCRFRSHRKRCATYCIGNNTIIIFCICIGSRRRIGAFRRAGNLYITGRILFMPLICQLSISRSLRRYRQGSIFQFVNRNSLRLCLDLRNIILFTYEQPVGCFGRCRLAVNLYRDRHDCNAGIRRSPISTQCHRNVFATVDFFFPNEKLRPCRPGKLQSNFIRSRNNTVLPNIGIRCPIGSRR